MMVWQWRAFFERMRCGIARRVGFDIDLLSSVNSIDELHPGEKISGPPCIVLPDQFERVRACPFGSEIAKEVAELRGAPRYIGPTLRYVVDNVLVKDGIIYGRGQQKYFNSKIPSYRPRHSWDEYDEVAIRSSFVGCHFFGHWLLDDCATHLLAKESGPVLGMPTPPWPDQAGYLALFGQSYGEVGRAYIKRLVLFDDICQNAHKVRRFVMLRAHVAAARLSTSQSHIAYVMRGPGGSNRVLLNEAEITQALERRGIVVVRAEGLGVPELVSKLLGARIIIGVEGSQIGHALFTLRDRGGVLAIQPPDRFFNAHMDWARPLGMQYGVVVGERRQHGFYLPVKDLLRTVDLMDKKIP